MSDFKNILKSLRIRDNLSQEELAVKLGISRSTIGMYEQGKREPDFEGLEAIADIFNVDMNYLTGHYSNEKYYNDLQLKQIAQNIFENQSLKELFNVAKNINEEDLPALIEIAKKLVRD